LILKTLKKFNIFYHYSEILDINDFIIDYSTLKFANQIGAGSTSVVFHGYLKNEDVGKNHLFFLFAIITFKLI